MSKPDKLEAKLRRVPSPKDFRWDDLITVARARGFTEHCGGGSHYNFYHSQTGIVFRASRTHPSGLLKLYQIKDAIAAIDKVAAMSSRESKKS